MTATCPMCRRLGADPGYAHRVTGDAVAGSAAELLFGPLQSPPRRKVLLGAKDDDGLAAVIDVVHGWPDSATAHIGLLQVHPRP